MQSNSHVMSIAMLCYALLQERHPMLFLRRCRSCLTMLNADSQPPVFVLRNIHIRIRYVAPLLVIGSTLLLPSIVAEDSPSLSCASASALALLTPPKASLATHSISSLPTSGIWDVVSTNY